MSHPQDEYATSIVADLEAANARIKTLDALCDEVACAANACGFDSITVLVDWLPLLVSSHNELAALKAQQGEPVAFLHRWLPHASVIGKSLHFHGTSPHGKDVEIIPLYAAAPKEKTE